MKYLLYALAVFVGTAIFLGITWAWIVPDVFAGAVKEGLLPDKLSLLQTLKLTIVVVTIVILIPTTIQGVIEAVRK